MRFALFFLGLICFLASSANAQGGSTIPLSNASFSFGTSNGEVLPDKPQVPSRALFGGLEPTASVPSSDSAAGSPQQVSSVRETFNWQAYLGYTFVHFNEGFGLAANRNGFNYSVVYYFRDWIAADGEFMATFGKQGGQNSWLLFGGGGPRFRWSAPRGLELWAHALAGISHFTPQTPFGKQEAFAYELGGGVDIKAHHQRLAYRLGVDMLGSRYFGNNQFSPKVSAGVVYKF